MAASNFKDRYEVDGAHCIRETPKAIYVEAAEFPEPVWVPKSQVDDDSEVYSDDDRGTLIVSEWLAKTKGWV